MIPARSAQRILRKALPKRCWKKSAPGTKGNATRRKSSRYWCSLLHAENSCRRIIAAYEAAKSGN